MRSIAYAVRRLFSNPINAFLFVLGAFVLIVGLLPQITALLPHQVPQIGQIAGVLTIIAGVAKPLRDTAAQAAAAKDKAEADAESSPAAQANARSVVQTLVKRRVDEESETPLGSHLQLGLMSRPDYIDDPTLAAIGLPAPAPEPLAPGASIAGVFEESAGRLLILGAGGAGKTGLLVEIAAALLAASLKNGDQPVPVVLGLTALPDEPFGFDDWLARQISDTYGISPLMAKGWIETAKVIVLLDGLGTLGDRMTERAVDAINSFTKANPLKMAIAARLEEYLAPKKKLRFHSAVVIEPLTDKQIDDCLSIPEMAGVRQAVAGDAGLRDLLKTPWMLGIVFKAYRNKGAGAVPTGGAPGEMRNEILTEYVSDCLSQPRDGKEVAFKPELARRWLDWLARQLVSRKQEVFFYDLMQPDLLPTAKQQWMSKTGIALGLGALTGVLAWIGYMKIFGAVALPLAILGGLVVGLAAYEPTIDLSNPLRWSWQQLRGNLPAWLGFGPLFGLLVGLSVGAIAQLAGATIAWLGFIVSGLIAGASLGIFFASVGALQNQPNVEPAGPGDAIRSTLRNALFGGGMMAAFSAVIAGVGGALIIGLAVLPQGPRGDLSFWLLPGLLLQGLAVGLLLGAGGTDPGVRIGLRPTWRTAIVIVLGVTLVDIQVATFMSGHFGDAAPFIGRGKGGFVSRGLVAGVLLAALVGIGTGICHGVLRGGGAYLRHRGLLWLLQRDGDIARDYLGFLTYASRVRLLQRRGGGYQFLHRYLLEHFANFQSASLPPASPSPSPPPVATVIG